MSTTKKSTPGRRPKAAAPCRKRSGEKATGDDLGRSLDICVRVLKRFDQETQIRIIQAAMIFLEIRP